MAAEPGQVYREQPNSASKLKTIDSNPESILKIKSKTVAALSSMQDRQSHHSNPRVKQFDQESMISSQNNRAASSQAAGKAYVGSASKSKQQDDLKHANNMNLNSYDILSLFKEMETAIRRVLAHKLQDVHFIIEQIEHEVLGERHEVVTLV